MADPLDVIASICQEQPHDALTQIADALGYTEQREQERTQREQALAGLVKRLARRLHPEDPLRVTATGYLQEQGFFNPLRALGVPEGQSG
jgi:prophage antirepressor-like protein